MFRQLRVVPAMLFAVLALVAVSCNTNDDPVDPNGTAPNAPTALMAQSRSATSVGLKWDAPAGGVTPTGYRVVYNVFGNVTKDTLSVSGASTTTALVTGLTAGTTYEFNVAAMNGLVASTSTANLSWAGAARSTVVRLYSGNNSDFGSGFIVFDGTPRAGKVSDGNKWDLAFDDLFIPATPFIASPGYAPGYVDVPTFKFKANGQTAKVTYLGREYKGLNSLDDIWETASLLDGDLTAEARYDLSSVGGTGGYGFVFANKDLSTGKYQYGKAFIHRTNGTLIQGTGADQYIEIEASYQSALDVPYALKAKIDALELQTNVKRQAGIQ